MRERQPVPETTPHFVMNFGPRVGILENGNWKVGWQQPGGKIVWHELVDSFRVLRQNERVIKELTGIPLTEPEKKEAESSGDPNINFSLADLKQDLIIFGELQVAQKLSRDISTAITYSMDPRTPQNLIIEKLQEIHKQIGPRVINELKVALRDKVGQAIQTDNVAYRHILTEEALETSLELGKQRASMARSLMIRASDILEWVDYQEDTIRTMAYAVKGALVDILGARQKGERVKSGTIEIWQGRFFGADLSSVRTLMKEINGNPYLERVRKPEVTRLLTEPFRHALETGDIELIERILSAAYPILDQVLLDREQREASGFYQSRRIGSVSGQRRRRN